ncbi:MAG: hypothetical protein SF029_11720 [bacterium]|nr:hypothetical protein [bacterium]
MLINDYVAMKLFKSRYEDPRKMNGIQRTLMEIINEYKDQARRNMIRKPRK